MKVVLMIIAGFISVAFFGSCYYDKADLLYPDGKVPCDTSVVAKFSSEVLPIMNASCNASGCHNSIDASSGVILDTYAGIKTQALNGRLIGSTDPINGTMPKNMSKLTNCTLVKIQQWIDSGTPNN